MRKFGLDGSDLNQLDVEYLDGKLEHKWFQFGLDDAGCPIDQTVLSREYSAEWQP